MATEICGLPGTRDFYPDDYKIREWLINKWKASSTLYGFNGYDAPILEKTCLYKRKAGDDIVNEMYTFKDKDGNNICLRPEMTPSLVRMAMPILNISTLPLKWFSVSQCWRFETTTRGRKREHYQWNNDIISGETIPSIIEIISMIIHFFDSIGLSSNDITIKISNRMIFDEILTTLRVPNDLHQKCFNIIDKKRKLSNIEFTNVLRSEINLDQNQIDKILQISELSDITKLRDYINNEQVLDEMITIFDILSKNNMLDWIQFDVSIVRGLSYYTGIVFEAVSTNTDLKRSICGGGQYSNLFMCYGYDKPVNTIGFGLGDVVIIEILKDLNKIQLIDTCVDYCIICYSKELYIESIKYSAMLRKKNISTCTYMKYDGKLRNAFEYANKINAKKTILFCPTEFSNNQIIVKDLQLNLGKQNKNKGSIVDINQFFN